jgi:hypothetical protein
MGRKLLLCYARKDIQCPTHGRVQEAIPWAPTYSRITYRLAWRICALRQIMTQKAAAEMLKMPPSTLSELLRRIITRVRHGHKIRGLVTLGVLTHLHDQLATLNASGKLELTQGHREARRGHSGHPTRGPGIRGAGRDQARPGTGHAAQPLHTAQQSRHRSPPADRGRCGHPGGHPVPPDLHRRGAARGQDPQGPADPLPQIALGELSERFARRKGLAEVTGYFNLASRRDKALMTTLANPMPPPSAPRTTGLDRSYWVGLPGRRPRSGPLRDRQIFRREDLHSRRLPIHVVHRDMHHGSDQRLSW